MALGYAVPPSSGKCPTYDEWAPISSVPDTTNPFYTIPAGVQCFYPFDSAPSGIKRDADGNPSDASFCGVAEIGYYFAMTCLPSPGALGCCEGITHGPSCPTCNDGTPPPPPPPIQ
jgi:hypothetical protein